MSITKKLLPLVLLLGSSCMLQDEEQNFVHVEQEADPQYMANLTFSYWVDKFYPVRDTLIPGGRRG